MAQKHRVCPPEQKELKRLVRFEGVPAEQRGEVWRMLIRCRVWGTRAGLGEDYYRVLEQHLNDPKVRVGHGQPTVRVRRTRARCRPRALC